MRFHSVDYSKDRDCDRGLVNRGFWFYLPRPLILCRLFGHKPVIDGTERLGAHPGARWVCCYRCGVRPDPQGELDPRHWSVGDKIVLGEPIDGVIRQPGTWPAGEQCTIGGQIVIGHASALGFSVKVGCAGSEHTLAAHASVPVLGALYLHTERFGTWLQRRLVPDGYESRVIEAEIWDRRLSWKLWAFRDSSSRQGWRSGTVRVGPLDIIRGEKRYGYEDHGEPVIITVTMPEGDSYPVTMQLQRQGHGRPNGRKKLSWSVHCSHDAGIPHRNDWKDGMCGWAVKVSDTAVEDGWWPQQAAAATVVKITGLRGRYGWKAQVAA